MMVTKGFYLQLCKQKYLIAIMHKKLSFAMFAFKSYRSFDAILQFFLQISTCYVKVLFYQVTNLFLTSFLEFFLQVSDMFHRGHIHVFFYRLLTCFVQFLNFFLTIHKHVSNKSRTCFGSFYHVSNQVTCNKKEMS